MTKTILKCVFGFSVLAGSLACAQSAPTQEGPKSDNTKINQRDRDKTEPTADQQRETKSDRENARQIRRAIVKDKSLSTYAHNVKIISQNGTVTLKGPVHSAGEKQAIEKLAAKVVGETKVKSEIQVANEPGK